jgi:hypothetical protein
MSGKKTVTKENYKTWYCKNTKLHARGVADDVLYRMNASFSQMFMGILENIAEEGERCLKQGLSFKDVEVKLSFQRKQK